MLANKIISSIVEIVFISLVPFIWWLVTVRKKEKFLKWIGIKGIKKENRKAAWISIFVISLLFLPASVYTLYIIKDIETAAAEFKGLGVSA